MEHRTKDGVPITMVRTRDVPNSPGVKGGWVTHRVTAVIEGKDLGHLSISWIPDFDERYPDFETYRLKFKDGFASELDMARNRAFHGEPFVAAVLVEPNNWRRGIGLALYREAALWLAQDWELRLRSGDPNRISGALWARLEALGEPVVEVELREYRPRKALDYRDRVNLSDSQRFPK